MKIPDLSKIDIKDIDINKIKEQLLERKELVLQVALGMVTFFIIVTILGGSQKEIKKYKSKIDSIRSKSQVIDLYNAVSLETSTFLKNIPASLSEDKIIGLVTDFADKNKVKMLTFTPNLGNVEVKGRVIKTSVQFLMQAKDFKDMVRFISDVESDKNILQIKSFSIEKANSANPVQDQIRLIDFRMEVASMEISK